MRFGERDRRTVAALGDLLVPGGDALPSAEAVGTADAVARSVRSLPPRGAWRVTAVVRVFSMLPLTAGFPRRFRNLRPRVRARAFARLVKGSGYRRQAALAVRQLVLVSWASAPEVSATIGYDGACLADAPDHWGLVGPHLPPEAGA